MNPPSKAARETHLCGVEITCNTGRPPGLTWRLAILLGGMAPVGTVGTMWVLFQSVSWFCEAETIKVRLKF